MLTVGTIQHLIFDACMLELDFFMLLWRAHGLVKKAGTGHLVPKSASQFICRTLLSMLLRCRTLLCVAERKRNIGALDDKTPHTTASQARLGMGDTIQDTIDTATVFQIRAAFHWHGHGWGWGGATVWCGVVWCGVV